MTGPNYPMHIVAVAGLVRNSAGQVLMLQSPRRGWEFPGGQVEEGEILAQALEREVLEETSARATVKSLVGLCSNLRQPPILMADFICEYVSGELVTSEESLQVAWLAPEDALTRVTRLSIRGRLEKMLTFAGEINYRAYKLDTYDVNAPYTVFEDRII
jgi:8-oxo-dGTP diphosphatase